MQRDNSFFSRQIAEQLPIKTKHITERKGIKTCPARCWTCWNNF